MHKTLLLTHEDCLQHSKPGHPERPERLLAVLEAIRQQGLQQDTIEVTAREATLAELTEAHPGNYITQIESSERPGRIVQVDADTFMSGGSTRAAKLAAGAVAEATTRVLAGEADRAFCAVRPPGHHAEIAEAFGFCLFNSVAVGARLALKNETIERVAILDFDVHHCNGTVDIFKDDPRVLVCSSFQDDYYPNRFLDFENEHIIRTPLAAGDGSLLFRQKVESSWLQALDAHKPQLIFVSAGFDAHKFDPLAGVNLEFEDYDWITSLICDVGRRHSNGRIVSTLEGGYDLYALQESTCRHLGGLLGGT